MSGPVLPLVGVTTRFATGAYTLEGDPSSPLQLCEVLPLDEAISRCWEMDAHLLPYQLVTASGENYSAWPRLNKAILDEIRQKGADIKLPVMVFDWDTPGHSSLTPQLLEEMEAALVRAADAGLRLALGWSWFYTTAHGARLVYVLAEPLSPEEYEPIYLGACRDFLAHGIKLDDSCHPWNWSFRLPRVTRPSSAPVAAGALPMPADLTWEADYFELLEQPLTLDARSIAPADHRLQKTYATAAPGASEVPTPERCRALLEAVGTGGKVRQTEWAKEARRRLRGRDCYDALFGQAPLARKDTRRTRIHSVAGEVCGMLADAPGGSAEAAYALLDDALTRLCEEDPDDDENFRVSGWQAICRYWNAEQNRIQEEREERQAQKQEKVQVQTTLLDRVLAGVRTWSDDPRVHRSDQEAAWWVSGRVVAAWKQSFFLLQPDGYYDAVPIGPTLIHARLRELGMDALVPLTIEARGEVRPRPAQDIINQHACVISGCEGGINMKGAQLRGTTTTMPTLVLPMYSRRDDLEPRFDPEVDTWLQLFGDKDYPRLCNWIGHALAFEEGPICALSIKGPPGAGKKLLYMGLAECIDTGMFASGAEFGAYQGMLMKTPFLVVNEGLHRDRNGAQHPADVFRSYVSGDPIRVRELYTPPILVRNPVRVMFLANNLDLVQELVGRRDLSPEDREALAVRILHIVAGDPVPGWLRSRGGLKFTRGWISGDDGSPSTFRIARHFLWLYQHRPEIPAGNRLIVEGNADSEIIRQMATRSGSAPAVIETLLHMIESQTPIRGMHVDGNSIHVTTQAVVTFHRSFLSPSAGTRLTTNTVSAVLKGLLIPSSDTQPYVLPTPEGQVRARWREIDATTLLQEAVEIGFVARRLEKIALGQRTVRVQAEQAVREIGRAYATDFGLPGLASPSPPQ